VLRTPANNKLRVKDERGKEHVKLSTAHGGKSQLNPVPRFDKTMTWRPDNRGRWRNAP
jgi:hypothetical protein